MQLHIFSDLSWSEMGSCLVPENQFSGRWLPADGSDAEVKLYCGVDTNHKLGDCCQISALRTKWISLAEPGEEVKQSFSGRPNKTRCRTPLPHGLFWSNAFRFRKGGIGQAASKAYPGTGGHINRHEGVWGTLLPLLALRRTLRLLRSLGRDGQDTPQRALPSRKRARGGRKRTKRISRNPRSEKAHTVRPLVLCSVSSPKSPEQDVQERCRQPNRKDSSRSAICGGTVSAAEMQPRGYPEPPHPRSS